MTRRRILTGFAVVSMASLVVVAAGARVFGAETAPAMYARALAREQTVRAALVDPDVRPAVLAEVRAAVSTYEAIVRRYPTSSYSDNALWQAGQLSLDAYVRFGEPHDRNAGVRLLQALASQYPTSKLVAQVPQQLARVNVTWDSGPVKSPDSPTAVGPEIARPTPVGKPVRPVSVQTNLQTSRSPRVATITDIRRTVLPDAVRITIELDGEVPFHDERLTDPPRVFVDLPSTRAVPALTDHGLRFDGDTDPVRQIRIGRHPNATTRVVLEAAGISSYSVYPLYGPYRLVIDCIRVTANAPATTVGPLPAVPTSYAAVLPPLVRQVVTPLASRRLSADWSRRLPSVSPVGTATLLAAYAASSAVTPDPPVAPVQPMPGVSIPSPPPPSHSGTLAVHTPPLPSKATGGFSIARQLGLGVSRIVIDPGHGGHDSGTKGRGVTEAELVLDVALRLEKLLEKVQGIEVILTRRTDEFIALQERTAIANLENADLFLSIHANSSPSSAAGGVETYFLNFASNLSAAAVAARENAASGQSMGALPDFVKAIALNNKLDESRDFATHVQRAMMERLRGTNKTIKDRGVKQAPFVVLIGAAMPSVLAEVAFVTNPQEARLIRGSAYRQRIADALFNAVRKYQTSLRSATTTALR